MERSSAGLLSTKKYPPKISALVLQFSIPLIFVAFMLLFFPFRDKLQFDGDEGINLMKTVLVMRGYPLYDQIWSDQPPLLTYLLLAAFRVFGVDVNVGRFSVLLLSAVLLWASFQVLRLVWGNFHALAGVLLIVLLPYYMTLSVSVMVGLPSLTFAMLSLLAVIAWHLHRKYIWLILSAVALAISVLIKLFTGFLAPIIIVGILLADFSPKISLESVKSDGKIIFLGILVADFSRLRVKTILRELLLPAACWGLVFSTVALAIILLAVGPSNVPQLYTSHLIAENAFQKEIYTINYHLRDSMPVLLLALFGILFTILTKRWLTLYLIAWMSVAYLLLLRHSPVWYHHQLLVTVPAAMLAGVAVGEGIHLIPAAVRNRNIFNLRTSLAVLTLGTFALVLYDQIPDLSPQLESGANLTVSPLRANPLQENVYPFVEEYAPETQWMVTDMPMVAFRLNLLVPPNLVVLSSKRVKSKLLTEKDLMETILNYNPEQVLIGEKAPDLGRRLDETYHLVFRRQDVYLYVRNDIISEHGSDY
jgi:hypothetical protein